MLILHSWEPSTDEMFVFQERNTPPWVSAFSLNFLSLLTARLYFCYFHAIHFSLLCMQKKSISDLKSSGQLLDTEAFSGKVIQKSELRKYETKAKVKKDFFYLAVANETDCIKMMVYGKERFREIKEERSYLFRGLRIDDIGVKVNAMSRMSETKPVEVPEEVEKKARELICSESLFYTIARAKLSADGTVSVEGTVTKVSLRTVIHFPIIHNT